MKQMDVTCTIRHNLYPVNVAEATPFFTHSNNVEIYVLYNTFVKWMLMGAALQQNVWEKQPCIQNENRYVVALLDAGGVCEFIPVGIVFYY